ncbi:MAG: DNA-directed RNA polymerase subunit omega [Candidatus Eremiobacteraeota bacterium]|nr:DNA-directed RNA polymerase subunit omega [Candidatus Eremiobacteraeota bacterium]
MIEPSIEELLDKVDSKFSLVTMVSKRARQLNDGYPRMIKTSSTKSVSVALEEIAAGNISYKKNKVKEG